MASPATQGLLGLRPPCRLWQSMEAIPADTDDRGREDVTRDLFLSPNRTGITRPIVSQNPQILLANFNQWYFNNLVKKPRHKTHCRCPHRLDLSFQSSRSCALPNIKVLKDKDLEFANSIGWFLAKVREAMRMATWTRRMRRFLLNNGAASPSHPCAGKHGNTSKPPRFTNSGQEPTFLSKHRIC